MSTMPKRGGGSLTTPYLERTIPSFQAVLGEGSKIFAEIHYSRVGNLRSYEPGSSNAPLFGPSAVQTADEALARLSARAAASGPRRNGTNGSGASLASTSGWTHLREIGDHRVRVYGSSRSGMPRPPAG
jgi:hypothetical protein